MAAADYAADDATHSKVAVLMVGALAVLWLTARAFRVVIV